MKKYLLFLLLVPMVTLYSQKKCKKYAEYFDIGSKCIECGDNYTVEEKPDGSCVEKWYHKRKKNDIVIIRYTTFKSAKVGIRNGLFFVRSEDNKLIERGIFINDVKEGQWTHFVDGSGIYKKGLKEGIWSLVKEDSSIVFQHNYFNDLMHGEQKYYDASGVLRRSEMFHFGDKDSVMSYDTIKYTGKKATYPCSDAELAFSESKESCHQVKIFRQFLPLVGSSKTYDNNGIAKDVVFDLLIDENGKTVGCEVISSTSAEFSQAVLDNCTKIEPMHPAYQYDMPIASRVQVPYGYYIYQVFGVVR